MGRDLNLAGHIILARQLRNSKRVDCNKDQYRSHLLVESSSSRLRWVHRQNIYCRKLESPSLPSHEVSEKEPLYTAYAGAYPYATSFHVIGRHQHDPE